MGFRVVIDGNAFYEIDEDCLKRRQRTEDAQRNRKDRPQELKGRQNSARQQPGAGAKGIR